MTRVRIKNGPLFPIWYATCYIYQRMDETQGLLS